MERKEQQEEEKQGEQGEKGQKGKKQWCLDRIEYLVNQVENEARTLSTDYFVVWRASGLGWLWYPGGTLACLGGPGRLQDLLSLAPLTGGWLVSNASMELLAVFQKVRGSTGAPLRILPCLPSCRRMHRCITTLWITATRPTRRVARPSKRTNQPGQRAKLGQDSCRCPFPFPTLLLCSPIF